MRRTSCRRSLSVLVEMEDAPILLKNSKWECQGSVLPRHKRPKSWSSMIDPVGFLDFYGHPFSGLLWKDNSRKNLSDHGWRKAPNWECFFLWIVTKEYFICICGQHMDWQGRKKIMFFFIEVLIRKVDLGEPTFAWPRIFSGCIRSIQGTITPFREIGCEHIYMVRPRNGLNGIASWPIRQQCSCTKFQCHILMTTNSRKKNWNPQEKCEKFIFIMFFNCYIWHTLVDRTFYDQATNLHEQSQSGPEMVKTFGKSNITFSSFHMNSSNIVMC